MAERLREKGVKGPLKGLRILDLGLAGAGPIGPTLLAEWGAEVVKVELPELGNIMRRLPPLYKGQAFWPLAEGRHKKSVTIDLHTEKGQEAIKELVKEFDIVLENYRPGTLERWNLGYDELKKVKEDLILVRVSGFGQDGPYSRRTSYDTVGVAMGGLHHLTGHPAGAPVLVGTAMCDYLTAAFNALASLIAIYHRNKTGKGQWADIAQYEAIFRLCEWSVAAYDKLGLLRERSGNRHPSIAPSDLYSTRDGNWVVIEAVNDKIFARLAHAMGREDLIEDPRFKTMARRVENAETINSVVAQWVRERALKEVTDTLIEAQVPVSQVYSTKEILEDPHFRARGNLVEMEDPAMGEVTVPGLVSRFSRTPGEIRDTGVPLGAHNDEILRQWLKFGEEEIAAVMGKGPPALAIQKGEVERQEAIEAEEEKEMAVEGLRVLDIGGGLAGSFAATLLADFGAEVIKVEEPGLGDFLRQAPPFYQGVSLWWSVEARNKRSLTLDLRKGTGRELFGKLVAISDVVVESFRAGTLEGWGLGYEELKQINPRIILLRASSFGQQEPYRDRLAGEAVASAMGGLTFLSGPPDQPPVRPGYCLASYSAGIFGCMAIMAALLERDQSGEGQWIDLALYEPLLRFSNENIPVYTKLGELRQRRGSMSENALVGLFETRDGKRVAILAPEEKDFSRLARALGREELAKDPRFATMVARKENILLLNQIVADWAKGYPAKELTEVLVKNEVPNSLVYNTQDIFEDPHYRERANIIEVEDPAIGRIKMQGIVPRLSLTPGMVRSAGPKLGQHNEEVYEGWLGLDRKEFERLKGEGVI